MSIQGRKEQKQVVIEHKNKMFTAIRYFAMKIVRKQYKQRKEIK